MREHQAATCALGNMQKYKEGYSMVQARNHQWMVERTAWLDSDEGRRAYGDKPRRVDFLPKNFLQKGE